MIATIRAGAVKLARFAIVALLVAMIPFALMGWAASGSTLSNPTASGRAATMFASYIGLDVLTLVSLIWLHAKPWAWFIAALLALAPFVLMTL